MKKYLFSILIFSFLISFGQKRYSTKEIFNTLPLNQATKIKIISYNTNFVSEFPIPLPPIGGNIDSIEIKRIIANQKFPIKLVNIIDKENIEGINQIKTLNYKDSLELSNLLFNTCGKFPNNIRRVSMCFFPRNAILFYNENDQVFDFLEICFECHRIEALSEKATKINDMCDDFYTKLEKFFKSKGLKTQHSQR
ncbi:MAG: hypothetical protein DI622_10175 [Chryseobacterium sp.]|uniref:hypothetical protein n=1 Tax=Chryseobacterium sp. TaxID=1871047 RepID=UPI000DB1F7AE|nr:hypothetical protein [Chryseobacterium sp.]MPS65338.1 hypothetical protein [Chryseobacterium sp.]PZU18209.1 MAG: hypothetical protein DI622_10175 [Chryseobacterium sp.]